MTRSSVVVAVLGISCARSSPAEPARPDPVVAKSAPSPSAPARGLPPIDRSCASDDDCIYDWHYVTSNGKCCSAGCNTKAVSKSWHALASKRCQELGWDDDCPMKKCSMPSGLRCASGLCELVP